MNPLCLLVLLLAQEKFPVENHPWLRYKPGTFVRYRYVIERDGKTEENVQTLTLKEAKVDGFVLEDESTSVAQDRKPSIYRTENAVKSGSETVKVGGKEIPCTVWTTKGTRDGVPEQSRNWIPDGRKPPVRMVFATGDATGDLQATALDETVPLLDRKFTCNRLEGEMAWGEAKAHMTLWLCPDVPGGQLKMEMRFKTPTGEMVLRSETKEIHEEK